MHVKNPPRALWLDTNKSRIKKVSFAEISPSLTATSSFDVQLKRFPTNITQRYVLAQQENFEQADDSGNSLLTQTKEFRLGRAETHGSLPLDPRGVMGYHISETAAPLQTWEQQG
jgi:hypothetical protein